MLQTVGATCRIKMMESQQQTSAALVFKIASEPWEFEQIHRLNYDTFVDEIPQHHPNPKRVLVDRFHDQNTYIVCLSGREVLGMMCVREQRPFSLEQKVGNLWSYLPPARKPCEMRLLATRADHRKGRIFAGLARAMSQYCLEGGHDLALISGTTRQLKLYRHMGFIPFGPMIGTPEAPYQPMYLTVGDFRDKTLRLAPLGLEHASQSRLNFLPGPVDVSDAVRRALSAQPISHRSAEFHGEFDRTRALACGLVGARHVQILSGSGTLANDVVAGQLRKSGGRGAIVSNGEFGERLIDAARRFGLHFDVLRTAWGEPVSPRHIEQSLSEHRPAWLWLTHCETSTGMLNPLADALELCRSRNVRLCADCISTFGTMPLDLSGVWMATATSGKGIGSIPGLALVFHGEPVTPSEDLPRHLDLGLYAENGGVPFTLPSPLVLALCAALAQADPSRRSERATELAAVVRREVLVIALQVVGPEAHASPAVMTIELPRSIDSGLVGAALAGAGCLVGHESAYLRQRNWLQISFMSEHTPESVSRLMAALRSIIGG
jgi:aspartate aminotransferase-like enzyme